MITINSFGVELTKDERTKLYPRCGKLFPDGLNQLAKAEEYEQVRMIAENYAVSKFDGQYKQQQNLFFLFKYDQFWV